MKTRQNATQELHSYIKKTYKKQYLWIKREVFPIAIFGVIPVLFTQFIGIYSFCNRYKISQNEFFDDNVFSITFTMIHCFMIYITTFTASVYASIKIKIINSSTNNNIEKIYNTENGTLTAFRTITQSIKKKLLKTLLFINLIFSSSYVFGFLSLMVLLEFPKNTLMRVYNIIRPSIESNTEFYLTIALLICFSLVMILRYSIYKITFSKIEKYEIEALPDKYLMHGTWIYIFMFIIWSPLFLEGMDYQIITYLDWIFVFAPPLIFTYVFSSNLKQDKSKTNILNKHHELFFHGMFLFFIGYKSFLFVIKLTAMVSFYNIHIFDKDKIIIDNQTLVLDRVNYFIAYDPVEKYSKVYQKSQYDWKPDRSKKTTDSQPGKK